MSDLFGPEELRRCLRASVAALRAQQDAIDEANVFPVPDGDTGTNMVFTLVAAASGLDAEDPFAGVAAAVLPGARGNSGVILAQLVRGFLASGRGGAHAVAEGLRRGADEAAQAVLTPVEGTMLTVMRAAALAASGSTVAATFESAAVAAKTALEQTPERLPVLSAAGVLDAGGMGLWVILDAFAATMSGRPLSPNFERRTPATNAAVRQPLRPACEVQYILEASPEAIERLRPGLGAVGESVVISGGAGIWNVHVHCDDAETALSLGRSLGTVVSSTVTSFAGNEPASNEHASIPLARSHAPVTVVAIVSGRGFAELYRELGAEVVVETDGALPNAADIAAAIEHAPAADVVVLPNGEDASRAAMKASEMVSDRRVVVIETRDLAHGITTMLAYGNARDLEANAQQMRQAASVAASARVIASPDDRTTPLGPVRAGQWLGYGVDLVSIADDPVTCMQSLLQALDDEEPIEVVTIFAGTTAPDEEQRQIERVLRDRLPGVDIEIRWGGQSAERYLVAVE